MYFKPNWALANRKIATALKAAIANIQKDEIQAKGRGKKTTRLHLQRSYWQAMAEKCTLADLLFGSILGRDLAETAQFESDERHKAEVLL